MKEQKRGCGYRRVDGLYLLCVGKAIGCDRLNYNLEVCPICGAGIKFTRGFTWIDWFRYAGKHEHCIDIPTCPICNPSEEDGKYGLLWVGGKYYTPESFIKEAETQGISKRIATVPKDLDLGRTWILFAHKKGSTKIIEDISTLTKTKEVSCPAIFFVGRAKRIEKIITKKKAQYGEEIEKLRKRGITPIIATEVDEKGNVRETEEMEENNAVD